MQVLFVLALASFMSCGASSYSANAPTPLLKQGQPVDWWFVFKFNSASGPACGGDQVPVGSCASRLAKLYRHGLVFGPGPGLTTVASKAANFEERSCLKLKKAYLEKACKCTKQGLSFSTNEAIEDQTLEAYVEIQKLDKKWRDKAIKDPVINKIVTEAAKIRDCFNLQTVEILRDTEKKLEGALAEPAQDSTREVPTQKPQQDPLTRP